jgi:hypothetical protein
MLCVQHAETVNLHLWPWIKLLINSPTHSLYRNVLLLYTTGRDCMKLIRALLICWAHRNRTDQAPAVPEKGVAIVDSLYRCQEHNFSPPVFQDTQVRTHAHASKSYLSIYCGNSTMQTHATCDWSWHLLFWTTLFALIYCLRTIDISTYKYAILWKRTYHCSQVICFLNKDV